MASVTRHAQLIGHIPDTANAFGDVFGAAFLIVCDLGARTIMAPVELPVGVLTAMIGGPFFLWLLVRRS